MTKVTIETSHLKAEITDPSDDVDLTGALLLCKYALLGVSYVFDGDLVVEDSDV